MKRAVRLAASVAVLSLFGHALRAQSAPPGPATLNAHQQLAREVYKELVEINTVDSVGSVTKAAEAMAARFRAAGFPARDVQVLIPAGQADEGQPRRALSRPRRRERDEADPAARASRRRRRAPRGLAARSVLAARGERLLPRPRHLGRQGDGGDLRRQPAAHEAGEAGVPDRDIILALTADEEGGDANGAEWLAARITRRSSMRRTRSTKAAAARSAGRASRSSHRSRRRRRSTSTSRSRRRTPADTRACRVRTTRSISSPTRWLRLRATSFPSR